MAAGRRIPVTVEADTDGDFNAAARGLEDVARDADNADVSLRRYSKGHTVLQKEIDKTSGSIAALRSEFAKTGDVGLLKDVDTQERSLKRLRRQMEDFAGDAERVGSQTGGAFSSGFLNTIGDLPPTATLVIVGGITTAMATLGPLIGATLGGAILAGVGGAGLGGAIALQLSDSRVKSAVTDFGGYLKRTLTDATTSVAAPLVSGLSTFKREAQPFFDSFRQGIEKLAPYVSLLLAKLGEGLAKLGPGLAKAFDAAGPVLGVLANTLPVLFNGIRIFFEQISAGGKGAAEAISTIVRAISGMIATLGYGIHIMSNLFDGAVQGMDKVTGVLAKIPGLSALFGPLHDYVNKIANDFTAAQVSGNDYAGALNGLSGSAVELTGALGPASASVSAMRDSMLTADQAAGAWRQGLLGLKAAVQEHGTSLKENTTEGESNIAMLQDMITKARASRDAQEAQGVSVAYASDQFNKQIGTLIDSAVQMGFNRGEAERLIGKYREVPPFVSTDVLTPGMQDAINKASTLSSLLNGLTGTYRASVITTYYANNPENAYRPTGGPVAQRYGGLVKADRGLAGVLAPRSPGTLVLAGEPQTGGEVFAPLRGITPKRAMGLAGMLGNAYGFDVSPRQSGYANPVSVGGGGRGVNNYAITVNVPLGATAADVGSELVEYLTAYERYNSSSWRS